MIPVNGNEAQKHTDEVSKIDFYLLPMVGDNEYKVHEILSRAKQGEDGLAAIGRTNEIFDLFVTDWKSSSVKLPDFPEDKIPSKLFSMADKNNMVYNVILKHLNHVETEEKKS
jgi:hypothetical protein